MVNQNELDDVFRGFMREEYKDEQIGGLEGAVDEGAEGADPQGGEEQEYYDYGDLSDGDEMDMKDQAEDLPSNFD